MPTLLLAEDNDFSRDLLTRRLETAGYQVIGVANGKEALLAARQYHPDLILMDLEMPVMDGRAAIRALKTDPHTFRIPIIVVTSHTASETVAEAVSAGCEAFEAKPVILRRLLERISETLQPADSAPVHSESA
jgi:two-component system, cell cycle response regulator DivK